jgi:RNA-directed DNA polymerase
VKQGSGEIWSTFEDILKAYKNCRKGKQPSIHQLKFEQNLGENSLALWQEIIERRYKPSICACFVVTNPKPREIFAAHFRDRVVHHLLVSKLDPFWEKKLSPVCFACRKGMGTHGALKNFEK